MKKGIQDIVPTEKRSIRDIPLPRKNEGSNQLENKSSTTVLPLVIKKPLITDDFEQESDAVPPVTRNSFQSAQKKGKGIWVIAILAVIAVALSLTWVLSKTTVNLNIKKIVIAAQGVFAAGTVAAQGSSFTYDTIELTSELSKTVDATGTKEVANKATGTVIIYNNFGATSQALVAGTRLEDPSGLIFKLNSGVTVPGKKTVSGKSVPGSVEVKVTAESAGEKYNIALSDFTIVGFKGTPKFNAFYARSKTPMSGGMIGTVAVVSAEVLKATRTAIDEELAGVAVAKVKAELPKEFVFLEGAHKLSYKSFEPTSAGDNKANIKEEVTIKGYIFRQDNFVKALADEAKVKLIDNAPIALDHSSLKVVSIEENSPKGFFKLDGTLRGTYTLDEDALKKVLKGQKKKDVPKLLSAFPIIEKAQVIITPFWISSLPSSISKIKIVQNGSN